MVPFRVFHNPRCRKSREALKLLQEKGVDIEIVHYLKNPPSVNELDEILQKLQIEPLELIRTREKDFKQLGLSAKDERDRDDWLRLMVENPILIERPIVIAGSDAVVGRPLERVADLIAKHEGR